MRIVADKSLASNVVIVLKSVLIVRLAAPSPFNSLATPKVSEDLSARKRIGAKIRRADNKGCSVQGPAFDFEGLPHLTDVVGKCRNKAQHDGARQEEAERKVHPL